jgi:4'-phosphopantetheinyl transferase EntD
MAVDIAFDIPVEHGHCVGIRLPQEESGIARLAESQLFLEERAAVEGKSFFRRRSFIGGRAALREALSRACLHAPPVLNDLRGAPRFPPGIVGSISHKEHIAVALVAREPRAWVGVDVETDAVQKVDIASKVLAADEVEALAGLDADRRAREVLVRFSAKESIYKALDRFVQRFVGFEEVSVATLPGGGAVVAARLRPNEGPFDIQVHWRRFDGLVLTTARVDFAGRASSSGG